MPKSKKAEVKREQVFQVAKLFFDDKLTISQIANELNLSREGVYPLLAHARDFGFINFVPPLQDQLAEKIAKKFSFPKKYIQVVNVTFKEMNDIVALEAARWVLELIKTISEEQEKSVVGIGLGPGRATLDFCHHFVYMLQQETAWPDLRLVAITAGGPAKVPECTPISFFSLFDVLPAKKIQRLGLYAETLVPARDFERIKNRPGVRDAFRAKDNNEIDIVVTALGDINDKDDLLRLFLEEARQSTGDTMNIDIEQLEKTWIGNVQYRPYGKIAPILEEEWRAVTVFELDHYVEMARMRDKHVVLIGRQCGKCGMTRAEALRPLLTSPGLKVWSELVIDVATARDLLDDRFPPHPSMLSPATHPGG